MLILGLLENLINYKGLSDFLVFLFSPVSKIYIFPKKEWLCFISKNLISIHFIILDVITISSNYY